MGRYRNQPLGAMLGKVVEDGGGKPVVDSDDRAASRVLAVEDVPFRRDIAVHAAMAVEVVR